MKSTTLNIAITDRQRWLLFVAMQEYINSIHNSGAALVVPEVVEECEELVKNLKEVEFDENK